MPVKDLLADEVVAAIYDSLQVGKPLIVTLSGRSGSGKSTLLQEVREKLNKLFISSEILSTDDYNVGMKQLRILGNGSWKNYDADEVYDLELFRRDMHSIKIGNSIPVRRYDYVTGEPQINGTNIRPANVLLIEGIKANHQSIRDLADLSFNITTPLATSIGRRILRDMITRPQFADPGVNLAYYLEYAEPAYRSQLDS